MSQMLVEMREGAVCLVCVRVRQREGRGGRYEGAAGVTSPLALGRFVV